MSNIFECLYIKNMLTNKFLTTLVIYFRISSKSGEKLD